MGASASVVEAHGFETVFANADTDGSGKLNRAEFEVAARKVTNLREPEAVDAMFRELDVDKDGLIKLTELVKACVREAKKRSVSPTRSPAALKALTLADWLCPSEAQHGFATAHQILAKNPSAAKQPLKMPGKSPGSPWLPLHYLLARLPQASGGNGALAQSAAEPLVLRLLEIYPASASARVQEGVRWPLGHLPLEFGLTRNWSVAVVSAIVKAYPAGVSVLDPMRKMKGFNPKEWKPESSRGCRWMRKIATDLYASRGVAGTASAAAAGAADDDAAKATELAKEHQKLVLRLLPRPTKTAPLVWTPGLKVEEEENEKARKKAEKEEKKRAAKERKERLKAEKLAKRAAREAALAEKKRQKEEAGKSALKKRGESTEGDEVKLEVDDGTTAAGDDNTTIADSTIAESTTDVESVAAGAAPAKSLLTATPPMVPVPEVKGKPGAAASAAPKTKGRGAVSTARSPAR